MDQKSGKVEWTKSVKAKMPEDSYNGFLTEHGYASNTPVADGTNVYAFFGKSGVYAWDFTGKELWNKRLGSESTSKRWGSAASPILVGDLLVVNAAEESRAIYGLDKLTGEEKWKAEADTLAYAYGTPVLMNKDDLVIAAPGEIWGLNPASGKLRWWAETGISTGSATPEMPSAWRQNQANWSIRSASKEPAEETHAASRFTPLLSSPMETSTQSAATTARSS